MDLETLLSELRRREALIVHFSHRANMREGGVFPDDLQAAITNRNSWALSCCVVWPGHQMDLPGEVGIVLRPTAAEQVLSVAKTNSGSFQLECGQDISGGVGLTPETLEETFAVKPDDYNEWRVRGADVIAIFVASPAGVYAKKRCTFEIDDTTIDEIGLARFSITAIRAAFPDLRLMTMASGGPVDVD